jgi:hypothetical protein
MSALTLRSFKELEKALAALEREVRVDTVRAMRKTARWGVREIGKTARATKPRPYAWGNYERGWQVDSKKDGADIVNRVRHANYVEQGRRPGKAPPIGPIRRWVVQKRLALRPSVAQRIAYLIARKIARKGTKGRFVLARTMPKISARLARTIERVLSKHAAKPPRA